jgi:hypothetical protein
MSFQNDYIFGTTTTNDSHYATSKERKRPEDGELWHARKPHHCHTEGEQHEGSASTLFKPVLDRKQTERKPRDHGDERCVLKVGGNPTGEAEPERA